MKMRVIRFLPRSDTLVVGSNFGNAVYPNSVNSPSPQSGHLLGTLTITSPPLMGIILLNRTVSIGKMEVGQESYLA